MCAVGGKLGLYNAHPKGGIFEDQINLPCLEDNCQLLGPQIRMMSTSELYSSIKEAPLRSWWTVSLIRPAFDTAGYLTLKIPRFYVLWCTSSFDIG